MVELIIIPMVWVALVSIQMSLVKNKVFFSKFFVIISFVLYAPVVYMFIGNMKGHPGTGLLIIYIPIGAILVLLIAIIMTAIGKLFENKYEE